MTALRLVLVLAALIVAGATATSTAARWPAPRLEPEAAEQPLAAGPADALPPPPALIGLARYTYAPGAVQEIGHGAFGDVAYLERGELTLRLDAPAPVTRAEGDGEVEMTAADVDLTLVAGDGVYLPGGSTVAIRNSGEAPAALLVGFVGIVEGDPTAGGPPAVLAGIEQELIGLALLEDLPAGPASLVIERAVVHPSGSLTVDTGVGGLRFVVVERGVVGLRAAVDLMVGRGTPGPGTPVAAGTEARLAPGHSAVIPPAASVEWRDAGPDQASLLIVGVRPLVNQ
jgi:hypothetical protein